MLKRWFSISLLIAVMATGSAFAQDDESTAGSGGGFYGSFSQNQITMPLGYTRIGDQNYISLRLQPELTFGKFGLGLDIPLLFSPEDGNFRTEEYKGGVGPLRVIRYLRYGVKHKDPVYLRLGDLTGSTLGYGFMIYNYTNSASFEKRKIGLAYDLNYDLRYGVEGIYSDFDGFNLFAIRPYVRPLATSDIPIIKTTEFGISYVTDKDNGPFATQEGITEMGVDVGVTVVENSFIKILPYIEYARFSKNDYLQALADSVGGSVLLGTNGPVKYDAGQGITFGTNFYFNFIADILTANVKLERRFVSDNFVPHFFDGVYETNKDRRARALVTTKGIDGTFGQIDIGLIKKIQIIGGISIPDDLKKSEGALIHLGLNAPNLIPKIMISGSYHKGFLDDLGDAFKLDQRSLAQARLAYRINTYLIGGVDYKWTFAVVDGKVKATKYITPFVGLNILFPGS